MGLVKSLENTGQLGKGWQKLLKLLLLYFALIICLREAEEKLYVREEKFDVYY